MAETHDDYGKNPAPCERGDWVRFYVDGRLVIGIVERITKNVIGYPQLHTDRGTIDARYVLEYKR